VDVYPLVEAAAKTHHVPQVALPAVLQAESGLNPTAERWGDRTADAVSQIDDTVYLNKLIIDLDLRGLDADISFGMSQITVGTAAAYGIGNGIASVVNCLEARSLLFCRKTAINAGAQHLQKCYTVVDRCPLDLWPQLSEDRDLAALVVYNAGHLPDPRNTWWTRWAGNVASYQRALEWAKGILG